MKEYIEVERDDVVSTLFAEVTMRFTKDSNEDIFLEDTLKEYFSNNPEVVIEKFQNYDKVEVPNDKYLNSKRWLDENK